MLAQGRGAKLMKINPDSYPIIIIVAFVVGFILAMALGFRPEHGSTRDGPGILLPAAVWIYESVGEIKI